MKILLRHKYADGKKRLFPCVTPSAASERAAGKVTSKLDLKILAVLIIRADIGNAGCREVFFRIISSFISCDRGEARKGRSWLRLPSARLGGIRLLPKSGAAGLRAARAFGPKTRRLKKLIAVWFSWNEAKCFVWLGVWDKRGWKHLSGMSHMSIQNPRDSCQEDSKETPCYVDLFFLMLVQWILSITVSV